MKEILYTNYNTITEKIKEDIQRWILTDMRNTRIN